MVAAIDDSLGVVKTVAGVEIHTTKGGKFAAIVAGVRVELASLPSLVRRVEGMARPVRGMEVAGRVGIHSPSACAITGVTKHRQVRHIVPPAYQGDKPHERSGREGDFYVYDEAAFAELAELARQYQALTQRRREIIRTLQPITAATWPGLQAAHRATDAAQPADAAPAEGVADA